MSAQRTPATKLRTLSTWSFRISLVLCVLGFLGPLDMESWGCTISFYFITDLPFYWPFLGLVLLGLAVTKFQKNQPTLRAMLWFSFFVVLVHLGVGWLLHYRLFHPMYPQAWYKFLFSNNDLDTALRRAIGASAVTWWLTLCFFIYSWLKESKKPRRLWIRHGLIVGMQGFFLHVLHLHGEGQNPFAVGVIVGTLLGLFSLVGLELAGPPIDEEDFFEQQPLKDVR